MYEIVLFIHSWLRWIILILFIIIIFRSLAGWIGHTEYGKPDNAMSLILMSCFDVQVLLGLLLYFVLSPITSKVFMDFGKAMYNPALRFWGIEHLFVMLLAAIVVHLGRSFTKKASDHKVKFRIQAIYFLLALVLVLSRIPWNESARLFRGISH